MPIIFPCPHCQKQLQAPENAVGKTAKCKACGGTSQIPASAAPVLVAQPVASQPSANGGETILISCSNCGKRLRAPATASGKRVKCSCGAVLPVPGNQSAGGGSSNSSASWLDTLPTASNMPDGGASPFPFDSAPPLYPTAQQAPYNAAYYQEAAPPSGQGYQAGSASNSMANMYLANAAAETSRDAYVERGETWKVDWAKIGGGLLMMVGAVVWFFLGLAAGRIFFYPPILFIIGLVAVVKGFFDGD